MKKQHANNKKYKSYQIGFICVLGIVLIGLSAFIVKDKIDERKKQNEIMDSFNEYFARDELTVIYYTSSSCNYCAMESPILETIAKDYDLDYLSIDIDKLSKKQKSKISESLGGIDATPSTVIVKNEKVIAVQRGYIDGPKYVEFLIKAGILDEGSVYNPEKNLTFINYDKFVNLRGESSPSVIVIGASTCTYCLSAKPILSNLAKAYNIPIHYLTLDYISVDDRKSIYNDLKDMEYKDETFVKESKLSTPTVLIVQEGKVIDYLTGLQNVTEYTKLFKNNGVVE